MDERIVEDERAAWRPRDFITEKLGEKLAMSEMNRRGRRGSRREKMRRIAAIKETREVLAQQRVALAQVRYELPRRPARAG